MNSELDFGALAGAAGIGAVAGLRSLTAPALVSQAARTGSIVLTSGPCAFLGTQTGANVATGLALGELIADKLPFIPARISPLPLVARAVSGAIVGAAVYSAREKSPVPGAILGALAAIGAAYLGYALRKKLPGFVVALAEDAATIGLGVAVLRGEASARPIAV